MNQQPKKSIWTRRPDADALNRLHLNTVVALLGIEFTAVTDDSLSARMPVDQRTKQPFGLMHGGSSVVLAETIGSCAGNHCVNFETQICVGLEVNANHLRAARSGWVIGTSRPISVGRRIHVWECDIRDESGARVCLSRLSLAVVSRDPQAA